MNKLKSTVSCLPVRGKLVYICVLAASMYATSISAARTLPNACPVDGCVVEVSAVESAGKELKLTFQANFTPDVAKNHFHVWWGENFTVKQVGRSAVTEHGVKQGKWHRHADHPTYITTGAASTGVRGKATTICVSAADRNHNILDVAIYHCKDADSHL